MAPNLTVSVLEHSQVLPPPDTIPFLSLPLTSFDIPMSLFHKMQCIFFYELPLPKTNVVNTIFPNLKSSLSLTLKHYFPLAGNLIFPPSSAAATKPELQYVEGDSVGLILAECSGYDYNFLKGNHPQKIDDFYPLFPKFPRLNVACKKFPILTVQVTVFPNVGITIALRFHHVIGDARSIGKFMKAWTSINKLDGDAHLVEDGVCLPWFDRALVNDSYGLAEIVWDYMKSTILSYTQPENGEDSSDLDIKHRATYIVTLADIEKLKNLVRKKMPESVHVSSFVVTCAYVWTCPMKSVSALEEKTNEDEIQCVWFAVDVRAYLKPPVPDNYFGNCIISCIAKVVHSQLIGNEGFVIAAAAIGEAIEKMLHTQEGPLELAKYWMSQCEEVNWLDSNGVSGSPKFNTYEADFGWGKPDKFEIVTDDHWGVMELHKARNFEGGLEVGLSLSKIKMEAFESFFTQGLNII
ncbi:hypothetical protein ACH5RR_027942 [Cinchona calisaya]|uniref:Uncharacterized protein n=1 Tax=Cinchona calisaya TaxID=153742 RepID=A0ABD2YPG7_9GENT